MSLFASLGQGDIWALSGIVFPNSPLMDLLEGDNFTLEDLLREDELIQEVKAKNSRLMDVLCHEDSIERLIEFVVTPAQPEDSDLRKYKYPYLSCEVICCEVPEMLYTLTHSENNSLLRKLFSFLYSVQTDEKGRTAELDCYLAGYFEKILEMLFRNCTVEMMTFFNAEGVALLDAFLRNIANYSVMQIVQRLLLPHLPFTLPAEGDPMPTDEQRELEQCHWSFLPEPCGRLVPALLDAVHADAPLHVSDMLITVLQLSPPDTLLVSLLCESRTLHALLSHATDVEALEHSLLHSQPEYSSAVSKEQAGEALPCSEDELYARTVRANIALAATSVLDSLVSRLFEACFPSNLGGLAPAPAAEDGAAAPPDHEQNKRAAEEVSEAEQAAMAAAQQQVTKVCAEIVPFVSEIATCLRRVLSLRHQTLASFPSDTQSPRLGHHGLQLVKLLEALARVGSAALDRAFCEAELHEVCVDLLDCFDSHSVLHLSVQRVFASIFEIASRAETQKAIVQSRLLPYIMQRLGAKDKLPVQESAAEKSEEAQGESEEEPHSRLTYFRNDESHATFSARHSSLTGNLILIAHAAFLLLDCSEREDADVEETNTHQNDTQTQNAATSTSLGLTIDVECSVDTQAQPHATSAHDKEACERALALRGEVDNAALMAEWDFFCFTQLKALLDHQLVGSYVVHDTSQHTLSLHMQHQQEDYGFPAFQDEHFKAALASEMDPFQFEDDDHDVNTLTLSHSQSQHRLRRHHDSSSDDDSDDDDSDDDYQVRPATGVDFGATLRADDAFWAAFEDQERDSDAWSPPSSGAQVDHEEPQATSTAVFEDFADFSSFDAFGSATAEAPAQPATAVDRMVSSLDAQLCDDLTNVALDDFDA